MEFNINHNVTICVNSFGREILRNNGWHKKPDENGYLTMQLCEVMEVFGPHIGIGCKVPFETTIELHTKD